MVITEQFTSEQLSNFGITEDMIETGLQYDGVDLICTESNAFDLLKKKYAIQMFDIFGLGSKAYTEIAKLLDKPEDFFLIIDEQNKIESLKVSIGPAKTKTLTEGISSLKTNGIELWKIVQCLMIENCGRTIAKQFANYYAYEISKTANATTYSFDGLQKSVIEELKQNVGKLTTIIGILHSNNVYVLFPEQIENISNENSIFYVMTGSPKEFGFKTKSEFSNKLPSNWIEQKGLDKSTNYLITDDILSKSSKMKKAEKLGINVILYSNKLFN